MRGRLIFPVKAQLYRADRTAMAADPDGAGPLTSGLDDDFREPVKVHTSDGIGTTFRQEMAPVLIPAQVETEAYNKAVMQQTGDLKQGLLTLVLHFADLERLGLVDPTSGVALIQQGDRIGGTYRMDGVLIQQFPDPPGMYVRQAQPRFGLGGMRNLLLVTCQSRDQGGTG